jgi:hypothetical protein
MNHLPETRKLERRFELERNIANAVGAMGAEVFRMGLALKEIKEDKLWRITHQKFEDYSRETFGYGKSWAYDLIRIYDTFYPVALSHKVPVDVTRMHKLLPLVNDENAEELYLMAAETNWTGFENNIKNLKGNGGTDECENHDFVIISRCRKCGFTEKSK